MPAPANPISEFAENALQESKEARATLSVVETRFLGEEGVSDPGLHFSNYADMVWSRIITLFDDCVLLLDNDRISAACVLARCILETYAVGDFAAHEVVRTFNDGGLKKASATVLGYVNSSRFKVEEQKRLKAGKFKEDDYHFTAQALKRMKGEEAVSKHILNAMRHLFAREMAITGAKESRFELVYDQLSEWTHPSQTSLFHAFTPRAWLTETSVGKISVWDAARAACAHGMHCITALPDLHDRMNDVARQLSTAFEKAEHTTG